MRPPRLSGGVRQSESDVMRAQVLLGTILAIFATASGCASTKPMTDPVQVLGVGDPCEAGYIFIACGQIVGRFEGNVIGVLADGQRVPIRGAELFMQYSPEGPLYPLDITTSRSGRFRQPVDTSYHTYRTCSDGRVTETIHYSEMDLVVRASGCE